MEILIGEMARLQGISNQTLIHYDKIGLLVPNYHPFSGYRIYNEKHILRLDTILALKESGMGLKEIKSYLAEDDPGKTAALLEGQSRKLEKRIRRIEGVKKQLDFRLSLIRGYHADKNLSGFIEIEDIHAAIAELPAEQWGLGHETVIKRLYHRVKDLDDTLLLDLGVITDSSILKNDNLNQAEQMFAFIPLHRPFPDSPLYQRLPGGRFAYTYHRGAYQDLGEGYRRLADFIRNEGCLISGNILELPVIDALSTQDPANFVTEIMVHVE